MARPTVTSAEYVKIVGQVVVNAAAIDVIMCSTFRVLSGCGIPIANAIFFAFDSLPGRRTLLSRVADLGDAQERKLTEGIIAAVEKSNNQRKQVAHALLLFQTQTSDSEFTAFSPKSGQLRHPTKDSLENLLTETRRAFQEAHQLFVELCQKRGLPPKVAL